MLGRRGPIVGRQLLAVPGAVMELSSLADAVPGVGRGRGKADGRAEDQTPAPGAGAGVQPSRGQQSPRGKPHHGYRAAAGGRPQDQQQFQRQRHNRDGRPPQPRGGDQNRTRGGRPPARGAMQGGRYQNPMGSLRDDIAALSEAFKGTDVVVDVPQAEAGKVVEKASLDDVFPELEYAVNKHSLPLLKYSVKAADIKRLLSGNMSPDEQQYMMTKLQATVFNSSSGAERAMLADAHAALEPNSHIDAVLSSPSASGEADPGQVFDMCKDELMQVFHLSEEEFERYKREVAEELKAEMQGETNAADKGLVDMLKSSNLEPNSTYYESIAEKLRAIEANPNWPAERKKVFAKRLVKNLA